MTIHRIEAQQLTTCVRALTGIPDDEAARRVIGSVISALSEQLAAADRGLLEEALPRDWGTAIARAPFHLTDSLHSFYRRVGRKGGTDPERAEVYARGVCGALAETLDESDRHRLVARLLPAPTAQLLMLARAAQR